MHFSSIRLIDRALSGATNPGRSAPRIYGNEGVLRIPQSSSISGMSQSDCLESYLVNVLRRFYTSAKMQSMYSTAPTDLGKTCVGSAKLPI